MRSGLSTSHSTPKPWSTSPMTRCAGHAYVVEEHLARRDDVAAHLGDRLVRQRPCLECLLHVDEEQGESGRTRLGVGGRDRAGDRHHPVGPVDAGDPDLLTLDQEVVAVAAGVSRDGQRVAAGIGFGQRHAELGVARRKAGQDLLLLLVGAVASDRHGAEAGRQDVEERALGCASRRQCLVGDRQLEQPLPATAVLLGHRQSEPAAFAESGPCLVREAVFLLEA